MIQSKIRMGVVGLGNFGRLHALTLAGLAEAELVALRAGGLIPIARQYPGAQEFVESYRNEFPGADSSYHSAAGYGGCEVLAEAIRRVGSLVRGKLREAHSGDRP